MIYPHDDGPAFGTVNHNQITISPNCDLLSVFGVNSSVDGTDINYATEPLEIVSGYVNHGKRVIDYICKTKSHRIIIKCNMLMDKYQWPQGMVVGHGERSRFTVNIINEGSDHYSRVSFIRFGDAYNYANQDHIVEKVSVIVMPLHGVNSSPLPDGMYINSVHQRVATYHDEASLVIIFNKIIDKSGIISHVYNNYLFKITCKIRQK